MLTSLDGTTLVSEGGMSSGDPMDVQWIGRTTPNGQRILMANLDMNGLVLKNQSNYT